MQDSLEFDQIAVPPQHQPSNGDDDDELPNSQTYFGVRSSGSANQKPAWKDLGLTDLMERGAGEFDRTVVARPSFISTTVQEKTKNTHKAPR
jgi:hypothetical protein